MPITKPPADMTNDWPYLPSWMILLLSPYSAVYPKTKAVAMARGSTAMNLRGEILLSKNKEVNRVFFNEFTSTFSHPPELCKNIDVESLYFNRNPYKACSEVTRFERFKSLSPSQHLRLHRNPYNLTRSELMNVLHSILQNHTFTRINHYRITNAKSLDDFLFLMITMNPVTFAYLRARLIWLMELVGCDYRYYYFQSKTIRTRKRASNRVHFNLINQTDLLATMISTLANQWCYAAEMGAFRDRYPLPIYEYHYYDSYITLDDTVFVKNHSYQSKGDIFIQLYDWLTMDCVCDLAKYATHAFQAGEITKNDAIITPNGPLEHYLDWVESMAILRADNYVLFLRDVMEIALNQMEVYTNCLNDTYGVNRNVTSYEIYQPEYYLSRKANLVATLLKEIESECLNWQSLDSLNLTHLADKSFLLQEPTLSRPQRLKMNPIINTYFDDLKHHPFAKQADADTSIVELLNNEISPYDIPPVRYVY